MGRLREVGTLRGMKSDRAACRAPPLHSDCRRSSQLDWPNGRVERARYDLVFIGSGLSSTSTLIELLARLTPRTAAAGLKLLVVEKADDLYSGIAYGGRAGLNSLILTSLKDFLPSGERGRFIEWLRANVHWIFDDFDAAGGALSSTWLKNSRSQLESGRSEALYIPRYLFGLFLRHRAQAALAAAQSAGVADCSVVRAVVSDVRRTSEGFAIELDTDAGRAVVRSRKVVLAVGSPPRRSIIGGEQRDRRAVCLIDDLYTPGLTNATARIAKCLQALSRREEKNVVIVGSNASAVEALYVLMDVRQAREHVSRFFIISPTGLLPERMQAGAAQPCFVPARVEALKASQTVSAKQIYEAVRQDILAARAVGLTVSATFDPITRSVSGLFDRLSRAERERFSCQYGVAIGRLQRRAGGAYSDVVENLESSGRLERISGRCVGPMSIDEHGVRFEYRDARTGRTRSFPARARVVINCSGAQMLSSISSGLIGNLLRRRLCVANASDRGFVVNDRLESSKDFHIIGPLLAGNIIGGAMVWHVEHCGRIISFAGQLARTLATEYNSAARVVVS